MLDCKACVTAVANHVPGNTIMYWLIYFLCGVSFAWFWIHTSVWISFLFYEIAMIIAEGCILHFVYLVHVDIPKERKIKHLWNISKLTTALFLLSVRVYDIYGIFWVKTLLIFFSIITPYDKKLLSIWAL